MQRAEVGVRARQFLVGGNHQPHSRLSSYSTVKRSNPPSPFPTREGRGGLGRFAVAQRLLDGGQGAAARGARAVAFIGGGGAADGARELRVHEGGEVLESVVAEAHHVLGAVDRELHHAQGEWM